MRSVDDGCQGSTEALAVGRSVEDSQGGDAEQPVLDGTEESSHGGDADQLPAEELERPVVSVQGAANRGTAGHLLNLFLGSSASLLRGKTPMHMWLTYLRGLEQVPLGVKQGSGGLGTLGMWLCLVTGAPRTPVQAVTSVRCCPGPCPAGPVQQSLLQLATLSPHWLSLLTFKGPRLGLELGWSPPVMILQVGKG